MKTRAGSLAERLLARCIIAELALNWPPDRAIKLPWRAPPLELRWTPAGVTLDRRWSHAAPPLELRWAPAGVTLDPRWTVGDDVIRPSPSSRSSRASWDEARTGPCLRTHAGLEALVLSATREPGMGGRAGQESSFCLAHGQNPKEKPVVMNRSERWAGPANSVPIPTSQTIRGVSW